jgi:hypothetical protein
MDHALVAVGYGTTAEGREFWILKNSWGERWGDGGYMYVPRNTGGKGACGLAGAPGYAVRTPRGWEGITYVSQVREGVRVCDLTSARKHARSIIAAAGVRAGSHIQRSLHVKSCLKCMTPMDMSPQR